MAKNILQFWSGGADSTYLLLQNLLAGHSITCTYININNNENKTKREDNARAYLKADIKKFCNYFNIEVPTYADESSIYINSPAQPVVGPQQVTFAMFGILLGQGFDEVQLGVVKGDDSQDLKFAEKLTKVYTQEFGEFLSCPCPKITMPIKEISKEIVYITLHGYDQVIGTNFIQHITCCEADSEFECSCSKSDFPNSLCKPCFTQYKILHKLGWLKKTPKSGTLRDNIIFQRAKEKSIDSTVKDEAESNENSVRPK